MTLQSTSRETALSPILEGDEIEVCIILEDLKDIIRQSEFQSISNLLVGWSGRRKRSKRVFTVASGAVVDSPSRSPPRVSHGDDENQTAERKVKKQAASSPATPLSLSLTESDEKQKQRSSRKRAKKKVRTRYFCFSFSSLVRTVCFTSVKIWLVF